VYPPIQKRALAEKAPKKSETALINSGVSLLRRTANKTLSARAIAQEARRAAVEENLKRRGLVGQKLGRHTVPEGEVDVQLGEDLSESLRGLKASLACFLTCCFRSVLKITQLTSCSYSPKETSSATASRVCSSARSSSPGCLSCMSSFLFSSSPPQMLKRFRRILSYLCHAHSPAFHRPKRRKLRIIEYEKHAWKRFDRE
jgi:hypothetical protein